MLRAMLENPPDELGVLDARNHLELPAAALTGLDLDRKQRRRGNEEARAVRIWRRPADLAREQGRVVSLRSLVGSVEQIAERIGRALDRVVCRYISRPAISEERLSLTRQGDVRVRLKTPYRDGSTQRLGMYISRDWASQTIALMFLVR